MILWGNLPLVIWLLPSPQFQLWGNRLLEWNDCANVFCFLQKIMPFWSHSASWPWPCICWVCGTTPSCTSPVIVRGVHLAQQQVIPCKPVLPPAGFLHQGILKRSAWRDVQGPTQLSSVWVLMSASDTLSYAWQLCYGVGIPIWTGPILAYMWCSNLNAPNVVCPGTTDHGAFGLLLC